MPADFTAALPSDIPSLDWLLNDAAFASALTLYSRTPVIAALREALAALRGQAALGGLHRDALVPNAIAAGVERDCNGMRVPGCGPCSI